MFLNAWLVVQGQEIDRIGAEHCGLCAPNRTDVTKLSDGPLDGLYRTVHGAAALAPQCDREGLLAAEVELLRDLLAWLVSGDDSHGDEHAKGTIAHVSRPSLDGLRHKRCPHTLTPRP